MNKISYKLVTITTKEMVDEKGTIIQQAGLTVRVPKKLAQIQVDKGHAVFVSKGKYKHIIKRQKGAAIRQEKLAIKRQNLLEKMQQSKLKQKESL